MLADSHPLGEVLYRKWHMYDMAWGEDRKLENFTVCGAPYGGPIALMQNQKTLQAEEKENILLYTSAGKMLSEISWDGGNLLSMGWSDHENLIAVTDRGQVYAYDIKGKLLKQFFLIPEADTVAGMFLECHFWGNGLAAMSTESIVYVAEGFSPLELVSRGPRLYSLRTGLGFERSYTSMAVIPPQYTSSGLMEVILGTSDHSVVVLYEAETKNITEDQQLQDRIEAPIVKIAVAPNGVFLACYRSDGILTVLNASFTKKVLDFDAKSLSSPIEIAWCGEDAVVMQWRNTGIVMVGPFGDWLNFPYDSSVHLVAEPDCCRIITGEGCEILQRILPCTVAIRSVGSTDPGALMFDAMEAFEEGDPKSDENIRSIAASNQLVEAVQACIQAAAGEYEIPNQQSFLKAASYGKAFCPDADPREFVDTARKLRVLNEVRKPDIGMPLTMQQYNRLTSEVLVARLTQRNHHFLALKICELLKLKTDRVLIHWACEKVKSMAKTSATDEEINALICKQLDPYGKISYLPIAEAAYNMSRRRLATYILDREPHPAEQIPLLLRMNEESLALQKAINSDDTDLIYSTLISLEARIVQSRENSVEAFYRIVHNHPEAANLLKIYYRNKVTPEDRTRLHQLLIHGKNYFEAGVAAVNQAFKQPSINAKLQILREACHIFGQGKGDALFFKTMTEEELDLLDTQRNLELRVQSQHRKLVGITLMDTIEYLIMLGLEEGADSRWTESEINRIVKKFKVSEKSLWYLKIHCYSKKGNWDMLLRLAQEKKSPVGYKPFAMACIEHNLPFSEVEQYVERISAPEEKFIIYMDVKQYWKAMEVAARMKDPYKLQEVGHACKDQALERQIQEQLNKL